MAFDIGFNFRSSSGYVTDGPEGVPVLGEAFPHTYAPANGFTVNAGWLTAPDGVVNRSNTNDPRIAGQNFVGSGFIDFKVDLSSGSAPGAGDYLVDVANGDQGAAWTQAFSLLDNTTLLIDGTNGGPGFSIAAGHFLDAALADVTASTTWTGTRVSKTFATTTVILRLGRVGGGVATLAHFRLTLATAAAASLLASPNRYRHLLVR